MPHICADIYYPVALMNPVIKESRFWLWRPKDSSPNFATKLQPLDFLLHSKRKVLGDFPKHCSTALRSKSWVPVYQPQNRERPLSKHPTSLVKVYSSQAFLVHHWNNSAPRRAGDRRTRFRSPKSPSIATLRRQPQAGPWLLDLVNARYLKSEPIVLLCPGHDRGARLPQGATTTPEDALVITNTNSLST